MLIAAFGITPERAKQVAFSIPYSSIDIMLVARKETKITGAGGSQVAEDRVPRPARRTWPSPALAPPGTRIMRFDDEATANQAVLSGQADATGLATTTLKAFIAMNPSANYEAKFALRHQPNGITLRRAQDRPARLDEHLHLLHQEQRRVGRDLPQVDRHVAARTAGVLTRNHFPRREPPMSADRMFSPAACPAGRRRRCAGHSRRHLARRGAKHRRRVEQEETRSGHPGGSPPIRAGRRQQPIRGLRSRRGQVDGQVPGGRFELVPVAGPNRIPFLLANGSTC